VRTKKWEKIKISQKKHIFCFRSYLIPFFFKKSLAIPAILPCTSSKPTILSPSPHPSRFVGAYQRRAILPLSVSHFSSNSVEVYVHYRRKPRILFLGQSGLAYQDFPCNSSRRIKVVRPASADKIISAHTIKSKKNRKDKKSAFLVIFLLTLFVDTLKCTYVSQRANINRQ